MGGRRHRLQSCGSQLKMVTNGLMDGLIDKQTDRQSDGQTDQMIDTPFY